MPKDLIQIILTSALISSLISGIFLFINDLLRRKSEEKRVMIEAAIRLTEMRDEQIGEMLKKHSGKFRWPSPLHTFAKTFKHVEEIWQKKYKK